MHCNGFRKKGAFVKMIVNIHLMHVIYKTFSTEEATRLQSSVFTLQPVSLFAKIQLIYSLSHIRQYLLKMFS